MSDIEDLRIKMLMDTLTASRTVPDAKKRQLSEELQYAQTINGNPDPALQSNKRLLLAGVSREIESYDRHIDLKNELAAIVNTALDNHAKNCVFVLMKARAEEEAKRRVAAAAIGGTGTGGSSDEEEHDESSIKIGKLVEAKGSPALILSAVGAVVLVIGGWVTWQQSKTREVIRQSMAAAVEAALNGE